MEVDDAVVQEMCDITGDALYGQPAGSSAVLIEAGLAEAVMDALHRHPTSSQVQRLGAYAVWQLAAGEPSHAERRRL